MSIENEKDILGPNLEDEDDVLYDIEVNQPLLKEIEDAIEYLKLKLIPE